MKKSHYLTLTFNCPVKRSQWWPLATKAFNFLGWFRQRVGFSWSHALIKVSFAGSSRAASENLCIEDFLLPPQSSFHMAGEYKFGLITSKGQTSEAHLHVFNLHRQTSVLLWCKAVWVTEFFLGNGFRHDEEPSWHFPVEHYVQKRKPCKKKAVCIICSHYDASFCFFEPIIINCVFRRVTF